MAAEDNAARIAVIGRVGRFPGAGDVDAFWRLLREGGEGISHFSEAGLREAGVDPARLADPRYVRSRGRLEGFDLFDADFFGFTPREAEITGPAHRLFLEACWHALEDAGYDPSACPGAVGVFASAGPSPYLYELYSDREAFERAVGSVGEFRVHLANEREFLPTWVSYKLNLKGPSVNVQTACSSSLVGMHLACQALLNGECDLALAGGSAVSSYRPEGYLHEPGGILSPDGRCRAFDAAAGGTVQGDGVAVVVLKRLDDALRDGDRVCAVILGSATNNDGASKVGFTAPSLEGQTRVISEALAIAGVDPATVTCVEAHGTGTRLGDPIEVSALTEAFRASTRSRGFCALGSVKTNIGHLDAAAGVAGLIKTVLALEHGALPPSLHFREPNPEIDFAGSPFYVNAALADWHPAAGVPRRAGISSFGIGGTNAHVVVEEAPRAAPAAPSRPWQLLVWSATTETALDAATVNLARFFSEQPEVSLPDAAWTLQRGRRAFGRRRALVCRSPEDAARALADLDPQRVVSPAAEARRRPVAFLFPGQGAQRPGATRGLYEAEPVFRAEVDRCSGLLTPHLGADLREALYGEGGHNLEETAWTQPAMFVLSYSLARLWMAWGVKPRAMIGHSIGEYVAACLAGVLTLEDALALVAFRGRLIGALPGGGMLAVPLGEEELAPLLGPDLSIASVNGPRRTVAAGPAEALAGLERRLAEKRIEGKRLRTSHAFHSAAMDPVLPAFRERVSQVPLAAPSIPYLSNVTGGWIREEEATDPGYWVRHLREPVRFGAGIGGLLREDEAWALLEVGPGQTLTSLVKSHPDLGPGHTAAASLRPLPGEPSEQAALLDALGRLWTAGVEVEWAGVSRGERRRRVPLPGYPFERRRHWLPGPPEKRVVETEEIAMSEPKSAPPMPSRHGVILRALKQVIHELTGAEPEAIDTRSSFLEIGVDSLLLIQASQRLQDRFRVRISLIQLLEELTTLENVAFHIEGELPAEALDELFPLPQPVPEPPPPAAEALRVSRPPVQPPAAEPVSIGPAADPSLMTVEMPALDASSTSALERIFAHQLQILAQQLQILGGQPLPEPALPAPSAATEPVQELPAPVSPPPAAAPPQAKPAFERFGPYHPIDPGARSGLTAQQSAYLDGFIRRYTERTAQSKTLTQKHRQALADGRASIGFRRMWKEIIYPIHGERSAGSLVWDADGNEYVDISMGFGLHFFGHSPDFVVEAIEQQLRRGMELGPQSPLAGEVAELVCEMNGLERAMFCNSGTEAVMGALRAARTVTRRNKIALFNGAYHGWYDGTLARGQVIDGALVSLPGAPGVPAKALEDVVVVDYGDPASLEILERYAGELAAVLVEPVQSRAPDLQPREFLHRLRERTERWGTALIFDEMVTGFRVLPGGAQEWFGVRADLATYGKLIAGGLPIGVLAGRSLYMDALDGGMWSFGDDSYPQSEKTMMAGAFFKHPLTMAASKAILERMRREGRALYQRLNDRTDRFVAELRGVFREAGVPVEVVSFGSQFRFRFPREMQHTDLFWYHLIDNGVFYSIESGNCFLTPAHGEEELARVAAAVRRSVEQLQAGGFFPGGGRSGGGGAPVVVEPAALPPAGAVRPRFAPSGAPAALPVAARGERTRPAARPPIEFSLYYFGTYGAAFDPGKYGLLMAGARFADERGFAAVWVPERHFHAFGGLSPNPSVLAAALARETRRVGIRAGSVVLPIHHPLRVAEEWSVVDNLSDGRAGVSFASGWNADDFVFAPEAFDRRHEVMYQGIETVRSLWRGERLRFPNGLGKESELGIHPLPRQTDIPLWLTASHPRTYEKAGELGMGVLTNLQTQSVEELAERLASYRAALARHGHPPEAARVTLLLHTFVGTDLAETRARAGGPLREYLRASFDLTRRLVESQRRDVDYSKLTPEELDYLLWMGAERYAADLSLIGTPESCAPLIEKLVEVGVTEIGCLIDFGVDPPAVLESLEPLDELRRRFERTVQENLTTEEAEALARLGE